jgi:hypothetical protein
LLRRFRLSLFELRQDKPLLAKIVILRESGVSSTPQLLDSIIDASEYWIARLRGR